MKQQVISLSVRSLRGCALLRIPNLEIRHICVKQIMEWFQKEVVKDTSMPDNFCTTLATGNAKAVEGCFGSYLARAIGIRDT